MSYVLIDYDIVPNNKKDDQIYEFENENEGLYFISTPFCLKIADNELSWKIKAMKFELKSEQMKTQRYVNFHWNYKTQILVFSN